jgi:ferritin-like metal-binding protein YciE
MAELQELLTDHLRDIYDAEKQLTKALPRLAKAASNEELKRAFTEHLEITRNQVARIEEAFEHLGEKARGKPCKAMKGLVEEGNEHAEEHEKGLERDLALTASAEKVEHYEIASYLTARSIAKTIGQRAVAGLMQETLREEEKAGNLMLQIAERLQREMKQGGGTPASARGKSKGNAKASSNGGSSVTTDHDEIRQWAEARGASPACVRGTGGKGDTGMIRLDFPGYSGGKSLQKISWDEWFEKFDGQKLALLHREDNFNKLIARGATKSANRR